MIRVVYREPPGSWSRPRLATGKWYAREKTGAKPPCRLVVVEEAVLEGGEKVVIQIGEGLERSQEWLRKWGLPAKDTALDFTLRDEGGWSKCREWEKEEWEVPPEGPIREGWEMDRELYLVVAALEWCLGWGRLDKKREAGLGRKGLVREAKEWDRALDFAMMVPKQVALGPLWRVQRDAIEIWKEKGVLHELAGIDAAGVGGYFDPECKRRERPTWGMGVSGGELVVLDPDVDPDCVGFGGREMGVEET